eukprot:TRINITY_DN900_c0_g2_i7.p1 TRINITY_DN900_c0_g2~~TRINITY_DN900_c0_g2_i7.p1  ORF type:complete len:132 (+),score=17.10 TRINITY_DN900_c0_g2_i7:56-451(+)
MSVYQEDPADRTQGECCGCCTYHRVTDRFLVAKRGIEPNETYMSCCPGCGYVLVCGCCVAHPIGWYGDLTRCLGGSNERTSWEQLGCWARFCWLMSCGNLYYRCLPDFGRSLHDIRCYCCDRVLYVNKTEE